MPAMQYEPQTGVGRSSQDVGVGHVRNANTSSTNVGVWLDILQFIAGRIVNVGVPIVQANI